MGKVFIIKAHAYTSIILHASRYANKTIPKDNWKHTYGLLIGNYEENAIKVYKVESLPFNSTEELEFEGRNIILINSIQQELDEEENGMFIVGWYHSSPGGNVAFSRIDQKNQLKFQINNSEFACLIFDHSLLGNQNPKNEDSGTSLSKYSTGFSMYRLDETIPNFGKQGQKLNPIQIDYIIEGLDKIYFANVLSILSKRVSDGRPLYTHYGENITLFFSYTNTDSQEYQIPFIAKELRKFKEIEDIIFYERENYDNIYQYMDESINKCDVLICFCSQKALKSPYVKMEWQAALSKGKKVIPVFKNSNDIPPLLSPNLGLEFNSLNIENSIEQLKEIILKVLGYKF